jgi:hypothetical protein
MQLSGSEDSVREKPFVLSVSKEEISYSSHNNSHGVHIFLRDNKEKLIGSQYVPYKKLFPPIRSDSEPSFESGIEVEDHPSLDTPYDCTVQLDATVGLCVHLIRGVNLPPASKEALMANMSKTFDQAVGLIGIQTNFGELIRDTYVKCRLVDWNGEAIKSDRPAAKQQSGVEIATLNPNWDKVFILDAECGLEVAHFVRLEIFDKRVVGVKEERIGAAFIPISDFLLQETERTYQITSSKPLPKYLVTSDLGSIVVKIKKIQEANTLKTVKELIVRSTVRPCTLYNTMWNTFAVPAGCVELDEEAKKYEEQYVMFPSYNALVLMDADQHHSRNAILHLKHFTEYTTISQNSHKLLGIKVIVYENQVF